MAKKRIIVWFRQDLRLHDNEALNDAISLGAEIFPVYIFDERVFHGKTLYDFPKTGVHRARFIHESVQDLKDNLRQLGSDLIVRFGKPEEIIFNLARILRTNWVYCNRERTGEEVRVQDALERNLWSIGQEVRYARGKMLYYTADLPFPITHVPDSFNTFRKEVERIVQIRKPLPVPSRDALAVSFQHVDPGALPSYDFLIKGQKVPMSAQVLLHGGESNALKRLDALFQEELMHGGGTGDSAHYLQFDSMMSAYLAQGCISPKKLFHEISEFSAEYNRPELLDRIFHRLMYRDHLRLMAKKYGDRIFKEGGVVSQSRREWKKDPEIFSVWATGNTGVPLVDAIMHQLVNTGMCNHRSRKLAANFLIRELEFDWRKGASFFESLLADYDPCSNWVNWMDLAGLGPDSGEMRQLNYELQEKRLDPDGVFVRKWAKA